MDIICIIGIFLLYIIFLIYYYAPSIDVVIERKKYKVFLWYTEYDWNDFTHKYETKRTCVYLFTI